MLRNSPAVLYAVCTICMYADIVQAMATIQVHIPRPRPISSSHIRNSVGIVALEKFVDFRWAATNHMWYSICGCCSIHWISRNVIGLMINVMQNGWMYIMLCLLICPFHTEYFSTIFLILRFVWREEVNYSWSPMESQWTRFRCACTWVEITCYSKYSRTGAYIEPF